MKKRKRCSKECCDACRYRQNCGSCYGEGCAWEFCKENCASCHSLCWKSRIAPSFHFSIMALSSLDSSHRYIPVIRKSPLIKSLTPADCPCVMIRFSDIYSLSSNTVTTNDLYDFFELDRRIKTIVNFCMEDYKLDRIWKEYSKRLTYEGRRFMLGIKGLNCTLICSPNFSNWFQSPRYGCIRNISRSIQMANEFLKAGKQIIFDVSSPTQFSHAFYCNILKTFSTGTIAINCQTVKTAIARKLTLERIEYLHSHLALGISFLIIGLRNPERLKITNRKFYVASSSALLKTYFGERNDLIPRSPTVDDFKRSIRRYESGLHDGQIQA